MKQICNKNRASHPLSIREPNVDFRKLADKLEQIEITMKLEETKKLKLSHKSNFHTTTSHINYVQDSGNELAEKITQILNNHGKITIFFQANLQSKIAVIIGDMDIVLLNVHKNSKTN